MQTITLLGMALCLFVLYKRARNARTQPPSGLKKRSKTLHLLVAAVVVWLVINMHLQHLNRVMGGEPDVPQSTWERVITTLSDWL